MIRTYNAVRNRGDLLSLGRSQAFFIQFGTMYDGHGNKTTPPGAARRILLENDRDARVEWVGAWYCARAGLAPFRTSWTSCLRKLGLFKTQPFKHANVGLDMPKHIEPVMRLRCKSPASLVIKACRAKSRARAAFFAHEYVLETRSIQVSDSARCAHG